MRFKLVGCLSTAVLFCISINSVAAIDIIPKQGSQIIAADPVRMIERELRKREREQRAEELRQQRELRKRERERRAEELRQQRELRKLQRQQELERRQQALEAARQAATERQRLEAERRRQYFESLSPEQKQAYIAEQKARQAQREQVANLFVLWVGTMLLSGSLGESQPVQPSYEYIPPDTVCGSHNDANGNLTYSCRQR
jgi:hypothetical protein